jgi:hypothetical protein
VSVVAPPGLKLCNPYFLISETNGRNASMNNSLIRVYESGLFSFRNSKRNDPYCYVSIFIPKVKLTCIATEIQLPYPEWIATCIQLKSLETYLLLFLEPINLSFKESF